jgi:hypothetical protein
VRLAACSLAFDRDQAAAFSRKGFPMAPSSPTISASLRLLFENPRRRPWRRWPKPRPRNRSVDEERLSELCGRFTPLDPGYRSARESASSATAGDGRAIAALRLRAASAGAGIGTGAAGLSGRAYAPPIDLRQNRLAAGRHRSRCFAGLCRYRDRAAPHWVPGLRRAAENRSKQQQSQDDAYRFPPRPHRPIHAARAISSSTIQPGRHKARKPARELSGPSGYLPCR